MYTSQDKDIKGTSFHLEMDKMCSVMSYGGRGGGGGGGGGGGVGGGAESERCYIMYC